MTEPSTGDRGAANGLRQHGERLAQALRSGQGPGARILRGSSLAAIVNVAGLPVSFVTQVMLARSMGAHEYGVYTYALSIVNILTIYATLGLENVSLRFVSAFAGVEDWAGVSGFAQFSYRATLLGSLVLLTLGGVWMAVWPSARQPEEPHALIALLLLLPINAIMVLQSIVLQGTGSVLAAQIPTTIVRPLVFIGLLIVGLVLAHGPLSPITVLLLSSLAGGACVILSAQLLQRRTGNVEARKPTANERRDWLRVGRSLLGISTFQMAASPQIGILVLGTLLTKRDAGIYSAANQLALPVSIGITAVLFVATPLVAQYYAQGRRDDLQRTLRLAGLAATAFALPALAVFVLLGRWILGLYGHEFPAGYSILIVFCSAQVFSALGGGIGGYLLSVSGNERANLHITAASAVANVVLVLALVHRYGMFGVAVAYAASMGLRLALIAAFVHRTMNLNVFPWRSLTPRTVSGVDA